MFGVTGPNDGGASCSLFVQQFSFSYTSSVLGGTGLSLNKDAAAPILPQPNMLSQACRHHMHARNVEVGNVYVL